MRGVGGKMKCILNYLNLLSCVKELNEDAAIRTREADIGKGQQSQVTSDRENLSTVLETMRAKLYAQENFKRKIKN